MNADLFSLPLEDGRSLDVAVAGSDGDTPLVFHHGTPASRVLFEPMVETAVAHGLRFVTYSRPGYGGSSRVEGRSVGDCAADAARIVDHLGGGRFFTAGWSGGGPHALACAALLPERVIACSTIAGVAPYEAAGLDWLAGMGNENIEEFGAAIEGPEALRVLLERDAPELVEVTPDQIADALGDLIPDVDRASLTGAFAAFMADGVHEALRSGSWGWFDDDVAFVHLWGFDLSDIRSPVTVWQGAQDRMVPFAHGEWLAAHIPAASAQLFEGEGHLSLIVGSFGDIVDDLIEAGTGGNA